jgi:hypothetical protein
MTEPTKNDWRISIWRCFYFMLKVQILKMTEWITFFINAIVLEENEIILQRLLMLCSKITELTPESEDEFFNRY